MITADSHAIQAGEGADVDLGNKNSVVRKPSLYSTTFVPGERVVEEGFAGMLVRDSPVTTDRAMAAARLAWRRSHRRSCFGGRL